MISSRNRNLSYSPFCVSKRKGSVGVLRHPHSKLCVQFLFSVLFLFVFSFLINSNSASAMELIQVDIPGYPNYSIDVPGTNNPMYYNNTHISEIRNNTGKQYWVLLSFNNYKEDYGLAASMFVCSNSPINISGKVVTSTNNQSLISYSIRITSEGILIPNYYQNSSSSFTSQGDYIISSIGNLIYNGPIPTPTPIPAPTIWEKILGKGKNVSDFLVEIFKFLFDPDDFMTVEVGLGEPEMPTPTPAPIPSPIPIKNPQGDVVYEIPQLPSTSGNNYPDINTIINNSTDVVIPHEYSYSFDVGDDHYSIDVNGSFSDEIDGVEDFVTEISDGVKASGSLIAWIPDKYLALLGICVVISIIFGVVNKMLE